MYSHHSPNGSNVAGTPEYKINEVLVEIDGWRLVKPLDPDLIDCQSYIVHMECNGERRTMQEAGVRSVTPDRVRTGCVICGETPPEEILGLEILHNGKI